MSTSLYYNAVYQRLNQSADLSQVNEDATRLPLEVGKVEEPLGDIFLQLSAGVILI